MQTGEILRSAVLVMENNAADDPRCLAAAQELYNVVSGLSAKEIRTLTTTPEQEERRRNYLRQQRQEQQQQQSVQHISQTRSSSTAAATNSNIINNQSANSRDL